jgi:acyl-CoA reductase-like NAD-dependent aldehyde dehydrogenase
MTDIRLYYSGQWRDGANQSAIRNKFDFSDDGTLAMASTAQLDEALAGLVRARERQPLKPFERRRILLAAADFIEANTDEAVHAVMDDAGYVMQDAQTEVSRTLETMRASAEEAVRLAGDVVPMEGSSRGMDRQAYTRFFPVGIVCAITPFNSPLGTLMHKVAPAIAAGNVLAIKPATYTPRTAEFAVRALLESGLPDSDIALLYGSGREVGTALVDSPIPDCFAFTGSTAVGLDIRRRAGLRPVQLELGSIAHTLVCADADVGRAAQLIRSAGFRKAGQVCTSVQNIFVEEPVFDEFVTAMMAAAASLRAGDYRDASTDVGPVISQFDAERIESWIDEAASAGAEIAVGGRRSGAVIEPTLVVRPPENSAIFSREIFGPVATARPFSDFSEAIRAVNSGPYGLAAGVFTNDLRKVLEAADSIDVGSLHVNQTSSNRIDTMPYGGWKESGSGTEGPHYAIREMSRSKLITFGA